MTDAQITTTNVEHVYDACERLFGRRPSALTPDAIAAMRNDVKWKPFPGWESMSDTEVGIRSGLYATRFAGVLLVVTEASLASRIGAFEVHAQELGTLVSQHLTRYGECFFDGDVIIAERDGSRIWLYHHEGLYAEISAS
jgi:hypothetical protein